MTRAIKFRAWDTNHKVMEEDFYINAADSAAFTCLPGATCDQTEEPFLAIMQFTGLLDKNDKEIYEGDVVALGGNAQDIYRVAWGEDGYWGFIEVPQAVDLDLPSSCDKDGWAHFEVIGNIHENPELLKDTQ